MPWGLPLSNPVELEIVSGLHVQLLAESLPHNVSSLDCSLIQPQLPLLAFLFLGVYHLAGE